MLHLAGCLRTRSAGAGTYEGYMNAISASFRSLLWRSSFIYQTPLALLALMLVWWRLPNDLDSANVESSAPAENAKASKLRRIDFLGAFLLATSIFAFLLLLNLLSKRLTFTDPVIIGIFLLWIGSCLLWLFVEARFAPEPIFPLRLLFHRDVLTTYLIVGLGITANMSVTNWPLPVQLIHSLTTHLRCSRPWLYISGSRNEHPTPSHLRISFPLWLAIYWDRYCPERSSSGLIPVPQPLWFPIRSIQNIPN